MAASPLIPCLACGFCAALLTLLFWPVLLVWAAVFAIWNVLRLRHDPEPPQASLWWFLAGIVCLLTGPVITVDLWSGFLVVWTLSVAKRLVRLRAAARKDHGNGAPDEAAGQPDDAPLPSGAALHEAIRFHALTLTLLGLGILAKAMLQILDIGIPLE